MGIHLVSGSSSMIIFQGTQVFLVVQKAEKNKHTNMKIAIKLWRCLLYLTIQLSDNYAQGHSPTHSDHGQVLSTHETKPSV